MSIAPLVVALVVAAVVASVGALAIAMILPSPRSTDEKLVIVAHGLFVLSFVLGALRPFVWNFVAITVTNSALFAGALIRMAVVAPKKERVLMLRIAQFATVFTAATFEGMRVFGASMTTRIVVASLFVATIASLEARNAWRSKAGLRTGLPYALVGGGVLVTAAQVWRIASVLKTAPDPDFLQQTALQLPGYLASVIYLMVGPFAFIAMRLEESHDHSLRAASRAVRAEANRDAETRSHDQTKRLLQERIDLLDLLAHEIRQPLNNASAALESAIGSAKSRANERSSALNELAPDDVLARVRAAVLPTQKRLDRAALVLARVISTLNNTLAAATMLVEETASIDRIPSDLRVSIELARLSFDETRAARVSVHIASENAEAVIDATLIGLAIRNLLDNALKFANDATPIRLVLEETQSGDWCITVTNEGLVASAESDRSLFEKRVRGNLGRSIEGAGLGLYIVRRVAELHGGDAFLRADPVRGQVEVGFTFTGA